MDDFEKLGVFYLGRLWNVAAQEPSAAPLLYDSRDLTTHAVCVGMTGSGKTGLGIALLEEALIDGVPVLAIDPKGDLGNLLLTFPELRGDDFRPWIDEREAARRDLAPEEYARQVAEGWRRGLADSGQGPERIRRLESAAERTIFTPGSRSGRPLALLRTLAVPPPALLADDEAFHERVTATAASLLGLVGIAADPLKSREQILLASLLGAAWREGRSLDLPGLVHAIRKPPLERVGVVDLESFYPERERFELAMALNHLIASPGFEVWLEGEPLDVSRLLHRADGRPRLSIVSIAHLEDRERMFVVSALLNEVVSWVRSRPGSSSLAALLYMDEIAGFLPPVANPASKGPMLTLLKQARAFGLGVVLATQNPVDLDYKALANAGTWFLGRLQTERDKQRVLDGLAGATAGASFDRTVADRLLSSLPKRVFLMHDVHEDGPVLFQTRFALSYLAGPLTREQIRRLSRETAPASSAPIHDLPGAKAQPEAGAAPARAPTGTRPALPPELREVFVVATENAAASRLFYRPALLARASLRFVQAASQLDTWRTVVRLAPIPTDDTTSPWDQAVPAGGLQIEETHGDGARFAELPGHAADPRSHRRWREMLIAHLLRSEAETLYRSEQPRLRSAPGESEGEFRARLLEQLREKRDREKEKLGERYTTRLIRLRDRLERTEQGVARERDQYQDRRVQTAISFGTSVVGALFGRRLRSAATRVLREASAAAREHADIERAEQRAGSVREEIDALEAELGAKLAALASLPDPATLPVESLRVAPRRSDLRVELLAIAWCPWCEDRDGLSHPAFSAS